ncbi:MAG: hypothetical protein U1B30_05675 [Pseudomonadota bacterium]|nr:hypothetical protein [Pseudomonadota bacterium]
MHETMINVGKLRNLIGHEVEFAGAACQIIEILEDGPALILQQRHQLTTIQADQHGEAHRRVPSTITIQVYDPQGVELHADFSSLNLLGRLL